MNVIKQIIATAAHHSPKYANEFRNALIGVSGMVGGALAVQVICNRYSIGEFPNPFPRDSRHHGAWEDAIAGRSTQDLPDFAAWTKEKIEQFVLDRFDINLNTKMKKAEMVAEAERLFAG